MSYQKAGSAEKQGYSAIQMEFRNDYVPIFRLMNSVNAKQFDISKK